MLDLKIPIKDALQTLFPEASKQSIQKWLKQGRVLVNQQRVRRGDVLIDDVKSVELLKKKKAFDIPFEILYSDAHIIVVDKPAGLLSVASLDTSEKNVHRFLKRSFKSEKIAPLHRLDKEVAGPLIFVKTQKSFDLFKDLFTKREIHREYRALVKGRVPNKGTLTSYLKENIRYHVYETSESSGKKAITHYELIEQNQEYSEIKLVLESGRKNQIRVQLASAGYPILGDDRYGFAVPHIKGIALYAHSLEFKHPISKKQMHFKSEPPFAYKKLVNFGRLHTGR